jgi:hypothetical protein
MAPRISKSNWLIRIGVVMASVSLSKVIPSQFPHTYRFKIDSDYVRKFQDPTNPAIFIHHAYIPVLEFKREMLPDDVNPRSHESPSGRVPKAIEESVATAPADFHLLNRGILVLAQSCTYNNGTKTLEIRIDSAQEGGLADGATTDRVLAGMIDPVVLKNQKLTAEQMITRLSKAHVHLEIISGAFGTKLVALAGARNTSNQVKEFALENLDKKFDWLKAVIEKSDIKGRVRYRENDPEPVDVRTVLALLTLFHPNWEKEHKDPVVAYSAKGGILNYFRDDEWLPGYLQLKSVAVDIMKLYEHIHSEFKTQYAAFNKLTKDSGAHFGKRREITYRPDNPAVLPFTGASVSHVVPDGWLYPILAAFRMLLRFNGTRPAKWVVDPFDFFDEYGYELVGDVIDQSQAYGFNPQTVGKSRPVWSGLKGKVKLKRLELREAAKSE